MQPHVATQTFYSVTVLQFLAYYLLICLIGTGLVLVLNLAYEIA
jgi:hypothetical protein